ncbi:sulfatase-like hydrolase/transferase [Seonamhaeicola marinus]|uniref:Sulfatase-like hydrolase/transferase n=1 Tax=Seonamhaeicola marinus TaxID=1912246 RepID=A0A5D0HNK4_9FLAO|nr:sulfatase-like hydrolase/transferase [Seonamhaeicola marinus]TYA71969.1 sulfatase-like hydrolase/transferase [Seonamhaeicola marinus]
MRQIIILTFLGLLFYGCSSNNEAINSNEDDTAEDTTNDTPIEQSEPNILLIIADDFGLDACPGYNLGTEKPSMPNLINLMNNGLKFNNVWSNPTCSPTRAGILTGKHGFKNGVVRAGQVLSTSETSIQQFLDTNTNSAYSHAVVGKWHLARTDSHPNDMGVDYFAGTNSNVDSYFNWTLNINGTTSNSTDYVTSKLTDLAINWIDNQTKPWFLWLAYNAPHSPFHVPPNNLHTQGALAADQTSISNNPRPYYFAAVEALDTEMGRLLNSMTQAERDNTIIIFIGDNGTPGQVAQDYHSRRAKGTVYQGGVNVPMIVSGNGVSRKNQSEDALINSLDIFATVADIAETGTSEIHDSKSFKSLLTSSNQSFKSFIFTEILNDESTKDVTIRNTTHKYIQFGDGNEALYNLSQNALENPNLMQSTLSASDETIKNTLESELQNIID